MQLVPISGIRPPSRRSNLDHPVAVSVESSEGGSHNNLGGLLESMGQAGEAFRDFRLAVAANPEYAEARYSLGQALGQRGETSEGVAHLRKAVELRPDW